MHQALEDEVLLRSRREQELDDLQKTLRNDQVERPTTNEALSQGRVPYTELEERIEGDIVQMRRTLDDKERIIRELQNTLEEGQQARTRTEEDLRQARLARTNLEEILENNLAQTQQRLSTKEQEIRDTETTVFEFQKALEEEQQAKTRVVEELRQARCACNEIERHLVQIRRKLDDEAHLRETREQELRDKERITGELQSALREERQRRILVDEELSQARTDYTELEERLRNELAQMGRTLDDKERVVDNLQQTLVQEQQARTSVGEELSQARIAITQLEGRLQDDPLLIQSHPHDLQNVGREQRLLSKEERQKGNALEKRPRRLDLPMRNAAEMQSAVFTPEEASFESRRHQTREMKDVEPKGSKQQKALVEGQPAKNRVVEELSQARCSFAEHEHNLVQIGQTEQELRKRFIHRDVSSSNVLLWRRGESWRAKLSDFGTTNFMQQCMTVAPGALIYSAPGTYTPQQSTKVDVYSFGVLLCEMCTRELPDPKERHDQIGRVNPRALQGLIQRCVETDPEARPTMSEVIHELEQLV